MTGPPRAAAAATAAPEPCCRGCCHRRRTWRWRRRSAGTSPLCEVMLRRMLRLRASERLGERARESAREAELRAREPPRPAPRAPPAWVPARRPRPEPAGLPPRAPPPSPPPRCCRPSGLRALPGERGVTPAEPAPVSRAGRPIRGRGGRRGRGGSSLQKSLGRTGSWRRQREPVFTETGSDSVTLGPADGRARSEHGGPPLPPPRAPPALPGHLRRGCPRLPSP